VSSPSSIPQGPANPPSDTNGNVDYKRNPIYIPFKNYNIYINEGVERYSIIVFKSDESPIVFPISKDKYKEDLEFYFRKPLGLPPELKDVLVGVIERLRHNQGKGTANTVNESKPGNEVNEVKTANESKQQLVGSEVKEEITIPEGLEEIIESKKVRLLIPQIASILVRHLTKQFNIKTPVVEDTPLGIYCYEDGAYSECSEKIENVLYTYYSIYDLEEKGIRYKSLRSEFIAQLEDSTKVFKGFDHRLLLFKNGIFDWDRLERGEHPKVESNPDYMIKYKINHEIDWSVFEDRTCYEDLIKCIEVKTPFFRKVFQDWVGDKWLLLYEIIGYTLYSKGYPFNKAIMLEGEGSNGKSTYLALLISILGRRNVKSIALQDITSDKFAGHELYGVLANIYADLPNELLRRTGVFKMLTGEDYICFDKKYSKKRICFVNHAKLIFSCNQLPQVNDTTLAFWRRWIVIKFPNKFPDNPKFKDEIVRHPEIPSLIALSILAFKKVLERGKFSYQEEATDYREIWMRKVDPVYDFLRFMELNGLAELDSDGRVPDKVLYDLYIKYHDNYREDEKLIKKLFTEKLESYGIIKKKNFYVGIKLLKPLPDIERVLEGEKEEQTPENVV
jgi:P4 family phage/plasmid primase-like protien